MFDSPQALGVAAGVVALLGLVPGMPHLVFLIVGAGLGLLCWQLVKRQRAAAMKPERAAGTEVQMFETLPGWAHVRTEDGWVGWVADADLGPFG